jgi:hypothetical protein
MSVSDRTREQRLIVQTLDGDEGQVLVRRSRPACAISAAPIGAPARA